MGFRLRMQLAEALGPVNCWYCSQAYCRRIDDPDLLWVYFIKSGGAKDFANRYDEAMGPLNRWYCSEFYRREIREPEILWNYYMNGGRSAYDKNCGKGNSLETRVELSIAC